MTVTACLGALRAGRVVAFATDTLYALSCDPLSDSALERLRRLKGVEPGRPLPLLIPEGYDVTRIGCDLPPSALRLMRRYWPGKLTLVVRCHGPLARRVGGPNGGTLGLRVPEGKWLLQLLAEFDGPLVGTSANPTGAPPATTAAEARTYFPEDEVDLFDGVCPGGEPSTVLSLAVEPPVIEREGAIDGARLLAELAGGVAR